MLDIKFPILANYTVRVIIADNFNAAKPDFIKDINIPQNNEGCCVTHSEHSISVIFLRTDFTIGDLVHEASHAVNNLFRYIGAQSDEEIFAYHIQYLVDNTLKGLCKCRLKKVQVKKLSPKISARKRMRVANIPKQLR